MQTLLLFAPDTAPTWTSAQCAALRAAGYDCVRAALDSGDDAAGDTLRRAFAGRPPALTLADLSQSNTALPAHHLRRLLGKTWPDSPLPPCLAVLSPAHLPLPDWVSWVDDFLLLPCSPPELTARLRLLAFRTLQTRPDTTLVCAGLCIDLAQNEARTQQGSRILPLTPREFDLLHFLTTHQGKFWTRAGLLDLVWGVCFDGGERTVDIHIRRLRAKLPPDAAARLQTRRGLGYGFVAD